ncbi:zinc-binding dehydrogenase [Novosphingobium resinovorum]
MDYATAIALFTAYGTAFHALVQRGTVSPGETLVVLGASGGVGLAAVELGKAMGATVIAVSRTRARSATAAEMGADHVIGYAEEDVRKRVLELTGGAAPMCASTCWGRALPGDVPGDELGWTAARRRFHHRRDTQAAGEPRPAQGLPARRGLLGGFLARDPAANSDNFRTLAEWIAQGRISPRIAARYPLEAVPTALNDLLSRRISGKLVIDIAPEANAGAVA